VHGVALNSGILKGSAPNARLEQAAVGSPAIKPAPPDDDAEAIRRIQRGLLALGYPLPLSFPSGTSQPPDGKFGNETYQAVMKFQQKVFTGRAGEWDGRVGKNTLAQMDALLPVGPAPATPVTPPVDRNQVIAEASGRSRASVRLVLGRMRMFESAIDRAVRADGFDKIIAIRELGRFDRDAAVISDKLRTNIDRLNPDFRDTLAKARALVERNLASTSAITDQGDHGRCDAKNFKPPGVPFAATRVTDPDPRVSVCTPFWPTNDDMKRDVITHEFFHLLGLADMNIISSREDALNDANTMAQVVAYLHDRMRTSDSSGLSAPAVRYPSP
jgi:peptidoglycan hydrolase-like protein with peptidoglycan-binding domain